MSARDGKLVYSTSGGRMCPGCGWPLRPGSGQAGDGCKCSTTTATSSVPSRPSQIVAKLRMEKAGRGGKTVTVVDNLPNNAAFLKELSQELKRACGTGGAVRDGGVELQGDLRDRVRDVLAKKGYIVKG